MHIQAETQEVRQKCSIDFCLFFSFIFFLIFVVIIATIFASNFEIESLKKFCGGGIKVDYNETEIFFNITK